MAQYRVAAGLGAAALVAAGAGLMLGLQAWFRGNSSNPAPSSTVERDPETEREINKAFFTEAVETASASIDRARSGAQLVQTSSTAIAGLYTGALSLVFVAGNNPLPVRGLAPTVFLGLAVVLAAAYVAFLTRGRGVAQPQFDETYSTFDRLFVSAGMFIEWTQITVRKRQGLLRASIVSLAMGVFLLPIAFVTLPGTYDEVLPLVGQPAEESSADEWPLPALEEPVELAAILYQAQVDRYVESSGGSPTDERAENGLTVLVGGTGLLLILATLFWGALVDAWSWIRGRPEVA